LGFEREAILCGPLQACTWPLLGRACQRCAAGHCCCAARSVPPVAAARLRPRLRRVPLLRLPCGACARACARAAAAPAVAAPASPAPAPPAVTAAAVGCALSLPRTHDGFNLRLALWGRRGSSQWAGTKYSGGSFVFDSAFGGALTEHLILYGEFLFHGISKPSGDPKR